MFLSDKRLKRIVWASPGLPAPLWRRPAAVSRAIPRPQRSQQFENLPRHGDLEQLFGRQELFGWYQGEGAGGGGAV